MDVKKMFKRGWWTAGDRSFLYPKDKYSTFNLIDQDRLPTVEVSEGFEWLQSVSSEFKNVG